jgi:hypothetical protein
MKNFVQNVGNNYTKNSVIFFCLCYTLYKKVGYLIMKKNKVILSHCPNFYKIINFEYLEDDKISQKLIEIYKSFIFNIDIDNEEELKNIEKIDFVLNKYIDDYYFRKEMQRSIMALRIRKSDNFLKSVIDGILNAFDSYEIGYTRNIYFARWI